MSGARASCRRLPRAGATLAVTPDRRPGRTSILAAQEWRGNGREAH